MSKTTIHLFLPVILIMMTMSCFAQSNTATGAVDTYRLDNIILLGNRKTKPEIILRELDYQQGQKVSVSVLRAQLKLMEDKLMNTSLFISVKIDLVTDSSRQSMDMIVRMKERWYTWPLPIFSLADRNINDWVENHNADFSRLNYGIQFRQSNIRGRNEELGVLAQFGYTRRFGIYYKIPYLNKKQNFGSKLKFNYRMNQNLAVKTIDHKRVFLDAQQPAWESYDADWMFFLRKGFYVRHEFGLRFNHEWVADTVIQENPNYYKNGARSQQYFSLYYHLLIDHRDFQNYATEGDLLEFSLKKMGIGTQNDVDVWQFLTRYSKYWKLPHQFYFSTLASVSLSSPRAIPAYTLMNGLGFRPFDIRGYELNVIEGQHYFLNKWDFKKQVFSGNYSFYPITKKNQFNGLPFAVYLKVFGDYGYVQNYPNYPQNIALTDKMIYSFGSGMDIAGSYDFVFRLEVSYNSMRQTHFGFSFLSAI